MSRSGIHDTATIQKRSRHRGVPGSCDRALGPRYAERWEQRSTFRVFKVAKLWLEPGIRRSGQRMARLEAELERQRRFIGAEDLSWSV